MGLLQNFTLNAQYPYRRYGADATATNTGVMRSQMGIRGASQLTRFLSDCVYSNKSAIPYGYSPGFFFAMKPGGISSTNEIRGSATLAGSAAQGINIESSLSGSGDITPPSLSMIVQAASALTGSGSLSASMVGVVNMASSLAGSGDFVGALNVIAFCVSNLIGQGSVTSTLRGTARLEADIYVNQSTASTEEMAAAVWNALAASFNESGTMGQKVNAAGTAGDPWTTDLDSYTTEGTAGKLMKDASVGLTVGQFIALK